jgi:hypothetical protein
LKVNLKIANILNILDMYIQHHVKMNYAVFYRSQLTWIGVVIGELLNILVPNVKKKTNFKVDCLSIIKANDEAESIFSGPFIMSGRMLYHVPLENRIPFKYSNYIGEIVDIGVVEPIFQLYWDIYKSHFLYINFLYPICEIKGTPSIFLYKNIICLAKLLDIHNQPINRLMDWMYFDIKMKEKEYYSLLTESEQIIVDKNILYFKKVDDLRAKLMFFSMWDMEYLYNGNDIKYNWGNWDYWVIEYNWMLEKLIFQMDGRYEVTALHPQLKKLKVELNFFYDPEENMEYFNRLFNILGIINIQYELESEVQYYVSEKFNNYNKKYVELLSIMYTYDFKRWEEKQCKCALSSYEVEISYKIQDYLKNLRFEWRNSITKEKLEERNWRLLKEVEDLIVN